MKKRTMFFSLCLVPRLAITSECSPDIVKSHESTQSCPQKEQRYEKLCCEEIVVRSNTEPSGLYIGLTGMYAVPTETGLGTFVHSLGYTNSTGGVTSQAKPSKADYKITGGVQLGCDFGSSANRIEADYFYLHNSKSNSHTPDDAEPISINF